IAASHAMLKPSRSAVNKPSGPSRPNDPASQKKYTSHTASPNAKRMLSPARDRRLRRIVASSNKSKPPSPSRPLQPIRKDLVIRFRRQRLAREAIMAAKEISVKKYVVRLSGEERERLETLIRKGKSPARRVLKARILLKADVSEAGKGWSDNRIIEAL